MTPPRDYARCRGLVLTVPGVHSEWVLTQPPRVDPGGLSNLVVVSPGFIPVAPGSLRLGDPPLDGFHGSGLSPLLRSVRFTAVSGPFRSGLFFSAFFAPLVGSFPSPRVCCRPRFTPVRGSARLPTPGSGRRSGCFFLRSFLARGRPSLSAGDPRLCPGSLSPSSVYRRFVSPAFAGFPAALPGSRLRYACVIPFLRAPPRLRDSRPSPRAVPAVPRLRRLPAVAPRGRRRPACGRVAAAHRRVRRYSEQVPRRHRRPLGRIPVRFPSVLPAAVLRPSPRAPPRAGCRPLPAPPPSSPRSPPAARPPRSSSPKSCSMSLSPTVPGPGSYVSSMIGVRSGTSYSLLATSPIWYVGDAP